MHTDQPSGQALEALPPEIILYPNRLRTWVWLLLGGVSSALLLLGCIFVLILMIVVPEARNAGAIFLALLLLGMGGIGFWPTLTIANLLTSREPMLMITHKEVRVGKLYGPFEIVLP